MTPYASETWSAEEADILRRYFTNLDQPVFALVNLPEVVKGALFARYSRSAKSLRRLFLDEFVRDLDTSGDRTVDATAGLARAEELYARVFLEYGDDSVAQLGGVHVACEQASNVVTKVLERGRLMAYLEQSTRYVAYDARLPNGHFRYVRDPEVLESSLGARYVGTMDRLFDTYARMLPAIQAHVANRHPKTHGDSDLAHRRAVRAKALDAVRGLLPAGALSNVGIYGTGQSYEQLILRLRAHPLPEARRYGELLLGELRKVIPSFLARVDRPDRGGAWSAYLAANRTAMQDVARELFEAGGGAGPGGQPPLVRLVDFDPEGEDKVVAAMLWPFISLSEAEVRAKVAGLSAEARQQVVQAYVGERANRRHRPGRALERTAYRFEVVSDYGAFRDLQRHRVLTIEWQSLGTELGYHLPEVVAAAGLGNEFEAAMDASRELHQALAGPFPAQAAYAVPLAWRIRYVMQMSAREAMHVLELRSGAQGHPAYRRIAQEMHRLIAEQAGHRAIAAAMRFVDHGDHDLERLDAERRVESRRQAR